MQKLKAKRMCDEINALFPISPRIYQAMLSVDREAFVPSALKHLAYSLDALPLVESQWISSPLTVAKMSEYLNPNEKDSVLEIGCGSGYQAMILSKLFRRVCSIERIEKLLLEAKARFRNQKAHNIFTRLDDGQNGWKEYAPYSAILFSACANAIPQAIIDQLDDGGILVMPMLKDNKQTILRFTKKDNVLSNAEELDSCLFVPIQNGVSK